MQPGFSNMQPTPGYKGDQPAGHDPLTGNVAPLGRQRGLIERLRTLLHRGRSHPKP